MAVPDNYIETLVFKEKSADKVPWKFTHSGLLLSICDTVICKDCVLVTNKQLSFIFIVLMPFTVFGTRILLLPLWFLITSREDVELLPTDKLIKITLFIPRSKKNCVLPT